MQTCSARTSPIAFSLYVSQFLNRFCFWNHPDQCQCVKPSPLNAKMLGPRYDCFSGWWPIGKKSISIVEIKHLVLIIWRDLLAPSNKTVLFWEEGQLIFQRSTKSDIMWTEGSKERLMHYGLNFSFYFNLSRTKIMNNKSM